MEYVRTNNLQLAQQCLEYGQTIKPEDPYICNELGVVAFQKGNFWLAVELFRKAKAFVEGSGKGGYN